MATCSHVAPNGEKSTLYQSLEQKYGPDTAHNIWTEIRTIQFRKEHGDWMVAKSPTLRGQMTFEYGKDKRQGIDAGSTLQAIRMGERTATTRYESDGHLEYWQQAKKGDVIEFTGKNGESVLVEVTKPLTQLGSNTSAEEWSKKEGWSEEYFNKKVKPKLNQAWQIEYKLYKPGENLDSNGEPTMAWVEERSTIAKSGVKQTGFGSQPPPAPLPAVKGKAEPGGKDGVTVVKVNFEAPKQYDKNGKVIKPKMISRFNRESEESLSARILATYTEAAANPDTIYEITYQPIPAKQRYPSGYTAAEMANLMDQHVIPPNIQFSPGMHSLIMNSPRRIKQAFSELPVAEAMKIDQVEVGEDMAMLLLPKVGEGHRITGFFTPKEGQQIMNSVMFVVRRNMEANPNGGINNFINAVNSITKQMANPNLSGEQQEVFRNIYNQRLRVAETVLGQMESLGLKLDGKTRSTIMNAISQLKPVSEEDKFGWEQKDVNLDSKNYNPVTGEFTEESARGLKDWSDVSFELDPKDTASVDMKMTIATMPQVTDVLYESAQDQASAEVDLGQDAILVSALKSKTSTPSAMMEALNNLKNNRTTVWNKIVDKVDGKSFWFEDAKKTQLLEQFFKQNQPFKPVKNFLGMAELVNFEQTYNEIMDICAGKPQSFESFMAAMDQSVQPNIRYIARQFRNMDEKFKNEFTMVMDKQYQQFTMILFNKTKTGLTGQVINANRYSQRNTIIKAWQEAQKLSDIMVPNAAGQLVMDVKRINERWMPAIKQANEEPEWDKETIQHYKEQMQAIFQVSGITMTDPMMDYLFDNINKLVAGKFPGGIAEQFRVSNGEPKGIFARFVYRAAGLLTDEDVQSTSPKETDATGQSNTDDSFDNSANGDDIDAQVKRAEMYNPLYKDAPIMGILAQVAAEFTPTLHSNTHRSSEGKTIYDYGLHSKLSKVMQQWKGNFQQFKAKKDSVYFAKNNWILNMMADDPNILENMRLTYLDGVKPTWGKSGTVRSDMSRREQMLTSMLLFQNQGNGFNRTPNVGYLSLTHSDKTTTPAFLGMPRVAVTDGRVFSTKLIGDSNSIMYNIFKNEWERILKHQNKDFNNANYDAGKGLFYLIPDFNYDAMQQMVKDGVLAEEEFNLLWPGGHRQLTQVINNDRERKVINKILKNYVARLGEDTLNKWISEGLVNPGRAEHQFDIKYARKLASTIENYSKLTKKSAFDELVKVAAMDYAVNHFLFNTSMSQLVYGDPAQAHKPKFKGNDLKRVDLTMKEYAKRLAKDIAPGANPAFPIGSTYSTLTLRDVKPMEEYLSKFENLREAYSKVEGTDAQEVTTVQEHLDVMYYQGKIPQKVYDDMSAIITKAGPGGYYEFTNPDHKKIIMQPHKPVHAWTSGEADGAELENYVKSSSFPLYPPMTANSEMEGLRKLMETEGYQRSHYESAQKLGATAQPLGVFSNDGKFQKPSKDQIDKATKVMDRSGFRIQQEVPYEEDKEAIKIVTQMNKLIVEGIGGMEGFEINGRKYSGEQIRALKEGIKIQMMGRAQKEFFNTFQVNPSVGMQIQDKNRVYDILVEEAKKKGYSLNELQALLIRNDKGDLAIPLMYNSAADRFESLLMSLNKKIVDLKMPGKSYVQASNVGLTFSNFNKVDQSRVVWTSGYDGKALRTLSDLGPGQVLLPFNFFDESGNKLNMYDFAEFKNGKYMLDETRVPKSLRQLIGARIPNQGHNSMLPLEIVGFIPPEMGDLVIVPNAITKQMGADFDVDKLFTYKRNYTYDPSTSSFRDVMKTEDELGHRYLEENPTSAINAGYDVEYELWKAGRTDKTAEELQTEYFDVHWAILNHPDMVEKILRPLDKPDAENENNKLAKKADSTGYYHVLNQLNDFTSAKDAKNLVGFTSLASTFNSVIQNKDFYLAHKESIPDEEGKMHSVEVRDYIRLKDEHSGEVLELGNLSGNGKSNYTEKDGEFSGDENPDNTIRSKHDNHTIFQNAALDNAKNRTLDNLNYTPNTSKAAQAIIQLETANGQSLNIKYVTRLLTQPSILEFNERMNKANDSMTDVFVANPKGKILIDLIDDLVDGDTTIYEEAYKVLFDPQKFDAAKKMKPGSKEYRIHQVAALQLFRKLDEIGTRMNEIQSLFNQDTNGAGPNILTALDKADKVLNLDQAPIGGVEASMNNGNEQSAAFSATINTTNTVLTQLLPYHMSKPLFFNLKEVTGKANLSIEQQRSILKAQRSYVYTQGQFWWKDASADRGRLIYGTKSERSLAERVLEAKTSWGKDNFLLARLNPRLTDVTDGPSYVEYQAATEATFDSENNTRGWLELLLSEDPKQKALGEDLIRYSFLTGGIQDANSFIKYVPISYLAYSDMGAHLREMNTGLISPDQTDKVTESELVGRMTSFVQQYIQHNPEIARQINKEVLDTFSQQNITSEYPEVFLLPEATDEENAGKDVALRNDMGELLPYVSYRSKTEGKWILYARETFGSKIGYIRIDTLGNQFSDEYGENVKHSIFTENRALGTAMVQAKSDPTGIGDLKNYAFSITRGFYKDNSHYEQFNLKPGGRNAIDTALKTMVGHAELNQAYRTMAQILYKTNMTTAGNTAVQFLGGNLKEEIVFNRNLRPGEAGVSHMSGKLELNPDTPRSINEAADTFLHEAIHQRLQVIIAMGGFDPRIEVLSNMPSTPSNVRSMAQAKQRAWQISNPEVMGHLRELDRIRIEALNALRIRVGEEQFNRIAQDVSDDKVLSDDHLLYYGVHSVQELVAHVMTSPKVAEFLNNIQSSKGKSILEMVLEKIYNIIADLAKGFGIDVKKDSLFADAVKNTVSVLTQNQSNFYEPSPDILNSLVNKSKVVVNSQAEAEALKSIGEDWYNKQTTMTATHTGYILQMTNKSLTADKSMEDLFAESREQTAAEIIIKKLQQQLEEAGRNIGKARTREDRIAAARRYNGLKEDLRKLKYERNQATIINIAKHQLNWVERKVLTNKHATANDVYTGIEVANLWGNLINLVYEGVSTDNINLLTKTPDYALIQERAQLQRKILTDKKAREVVTQLVNGNNITLKSTDFNKDLTDVGKAESLFRTAFLVKPKLAQLIGATVFNAANNRDEHINRTVRKLNSIQDRMAAAHVSANDFIHDDTWSLVTKLSPAWYIHNRGLAESRDKQLERTNNSPNMKAEDKQAKRDNIWKSYWKEVNKISTVVDTRAFFNRETGAMNTGEVYDKAYNDFVKEVGDKEYADKLISQAQELYKEYLDEKEIAKDQITAETELTDEEKVGKSTEEMEALLKVKQDKAMTVWIHQNSPENFLGRADGKGTFYYTSGHKWLVFTPNAKNRERFYDIKFDKIAANEKLGKIYNDFKDVIQEMISYLPPSNQDKLDDNFLPFVSADTVNSLSGMMGKIRNFDSTVLNMLSASKSEEGWRVGQNEIPIMFLRQSKAMEEGLVEQAKDPMRVAEIFSMMALHYKYMSGVLDEVNVAESIINEVNRRRISGEDPNNSKPLENMQKMVEYLKDNAIYRKPRELEGKLSDNPRYALQPWKNEKARKAVAELTKKRTDLVVEMSASSGKEYEDLEKELTEVNEKLAMYEERARYLYASKALDTLITLNQINTLSYNPMSAVSNYTFAEISLTVYANAKKDFDYSTYLRASGIVMNSIAKYWTFGTANNETAQKINNLMNRSGMMTEISTTQIEESNLRTLRHGTVRKAIQPYNWQRSGDYVTKSKLMVAMMLQKQVEVEDIKTGEKRTIPLWEALNTDGEWDTTKYSPNEAWSSENLLNQKEWAKFRNKMRRVEQVIFGNQDKNAPMLAKKSVLWRLAGQFRMSWLPEGIAARFASERDDFLLDSKTKGRWITYKDLGFVHSGVVLAKQLLNMIPGVKTDPFTNGKGEKMDEIDMENMRRNFAGLAWTIAFASTIFILKHFAGDDKQGKKKDADAMTRQLLLNMLIRNHQDLMLYSSPDVFNTVSGNFIPATKVVIDAIKAMQATTHYLANTNEKDAANKLFLKWCRSIPGLSLIPKTKYMLNRDLDAISK